MNKDAPADVGEARDSFRRPQWWQSILRCFFLSTCLLVKKLVFQVCVFCSAFFVVSSHIIWDYRVLCVGFRSAGNSSGENNGDATATMNTRISIMTALAVVVVVVLETLGGSQNI